MQGSSRETAHSWGIVGTQLENHREQGANSRDSERQHQGRRVCFPGGPLGATRTPAISTLSSINGVMPSRSSYHSGNDRFFLIYFQFPITAFGVVRLCLFRSA